MNQLFKVSKAILFVGQVSASMVLISLLFVSCTYYGETAPLVPQEINFTENPVDISNPDRGAYRGRWQNIPPSLANEYNSPFGITPEVDHRVPVDENSVLYHGRQVPAVEHDDIVETEFYNGINKNDQPYVGGTGVSALPSISFMCFDLCNFSSNAFLSANDAFAYKDDGFFNDPETGARRTGKTGPLTSFALNYIRGLLQKVREGNGVAFLKFSYDGNGFNYIEPQKYPHLNLTEGLIHGPEPTFLTDNNPSAMCDIVGHEDKTWIEYHIWQLTPIFHEYEDIIMSVKTGMLGPWGEQHSSSEAQNVNSYKLLLDAYLEAVPDSRTLITHAGGFLAWYNETYGTNYTFSNIDTMPIPQKNAPESRIGFFNDSHAAGNWEDNGSLSEGASMINNKYGKSTYDRYKVIKWFNKQNQIYQGEGGIGDNVFGNMPGAIIEAQQLRITALNMRHGNYQRWNNFIYNEKNVTQPVQFPANEEELTNGMFTGAIKTAVFDPVYDGRTGLEFIRDRMGYRFVLRDARTNKWVRPNGSLTFQGKIQNVGFGNVVNYKNVYVILKPRDGTDIYKALTKLDVRDWLADENGNGRPDNTASWHDVIFSINMKEFGKIPSGDYDMYLKITDPKETSTNKRSIQFANHYIWNAALGANYIGSTEITP